MIGNMAETSIVKVRRDGQITIPDEIRKLLNIQPGDFVRITVEKAKRENGVEKLTE